jgi:hypothetical protein
MEMSKIIKYAMRALSIGVIMAGKLPGILADNKITLVEMVDLTTEIAAVGGWKLHIEIPKDLLGKSLNASVE